MAPPDNGTTTDHGSTIATQLQRLQSHLQHRLHRYQQEADRQYHNGELAASWRSGTEQLGLCFANADATAATAAGYGCGVLTYFGCKYAGTVALAALRISSAQPVIARVAGFLLVPLSGVVASHAMCYTAGRVAEQHQIPRQHYPLQAATYRQWYHTYVTATHQRAQQLSSDWRTTDDHTDVHSASPLTSTDMRVRRHLAVDSAVYAALALLSYKLLRGKLQHVAPSDLYKVGSYMRHTLPAFRGSQYASTAEKQVLQVFGRKYGCHHCGMRYGRMLNKLANRRWLGGFIGDHIPPNKYAHGSKGSSKGAAASTAKIKQLFLPQCTTCSSKQSAAVRDDIRTLVLPRSLRWRDLFLPLPLFALLLLPGVHHIGDRVEEREQAEQSMTSKLRRWLAG